MRNIVDKINEGFFKNTGTDNKAKAAVDFMKGIYEEMKSKTYKELDSMNRAERSLLEYQLIDHLKAIENFIDEGEVIISYYVNLPWNHKSTLCTITMSKAAGSCNWIYTSGGFKSGWNAETMAGYIIGNMIEEIKYADKEKPNYSIQNSIKYNIKLKK